MSISGYQSDIPQIGIPQPSGNSVQLLEILPEHLNPGLLHSPSRNGYSVINENLVVGKDIRLRSRTGEQSIVGWQVSLPAPLVVNQADYTGTLLSLEGNPFFYAIDADGRVFLQGTFTSPEDEVILNVNPYVAELPLRFRNFEMRPVFINPTEEREEPQREF